MTIMKKLLLTIIFAIFSTNVSAQDYDDGIEAWGNKNYALAISNLEPLAIQGHLKAQKALGMIFFSTLGNPHPHLTSPYHPKASQTLNNLIRF